MSSKEDGVSILIVQDPCAAVHVCGSYSKEHPTYRKFGGF